MEQGHSPLNYRVFRRDRAGSQWAERGVVNGRPNTAAALREARRQDRILRTPGKYQFITEAAL